MCFRKAYFGSHRPIRRDCVETRRRHHVHDGRLAPRRRSNERGREPQARCTAVSTGPYEPKSEDSPTPAYHKVGAWLRARAARRA